MEIFKTLCRYRFLRSTYLHAFVGGESEKRFKERLGDLFHEGYLDRPTEQWRFADARFLPVVHELGKGGREVMAAEAAAEPEAITWLRDGPHRQFEHSLMTCEVLASIELEMRGHSDIRMIRWPEILSKAPESTRHSAKPYQLSAGDELASVVPDAIFGIEYQRDGRKAYRFFAIEADRGTMPILRTDKRQTSLIAKLAVYREAISKGSHKAHWGIPNLLVLVVTLSSSHLEHLLKSAAHDDGGSAATLFRSIAATDLRAVPSSSFLLEPWNRVGYPPLTINVP
ncbi:MAG: replication-relaxation family protein [Rhizomicrobium sp.]